MVAALAKHRIFKVGKENMVVVEYMLYKVLLKAVTKELVKFNVNFIILTIPCLQARMLFNPYY